jgi:hypothetical protein
MKALVCLSKGSQDGDGCLQSLGGVTGIQEGKWTAPWRSTSSAVIIGIHYTMVANNDFV